MVYTMLYYIYGVHHNNLKGVDNMKLFEWELKLLICSVERDISSSLADLEFCKARFEECDEGSLFDRDHWSRGIDICCRDINNLCALKDKLVNYKGDLLL